MGTLVGVVECPWLRSWSRWRTWLRFDRWVEFSPRRPLRSVGLEPPEGSMPFCATLGLKVHSSTSLRDFSRFWCWMRCSFCCCQA